MYRVLGKHFHILDDDDDEHTRLEGIARQRVIQAQVVVMNDDDGTFLWAK